MYFFTVAGPSINNMQSLKKNHGLAKQKVSFRVMSKEQ